jgi:hypothetical protein
MPTLFTEAQIRTAIETVLTANAPNAVVFPWWVLGHDQNMWPGLLKPASGPDVDKVHGYVITREQTDGERKNPQCVTRDFSYAIWGFRFYETGTMSANSDLSFNAELDAICNAFVIGSSLPLELGRAEPPQFRIDLDLFGGELLHYAIGRLVVEQQ